MAIGRFAIRPNSGRYVWPTLKSIATAIVAVASLHWGTASALEDVTLGVAAQPTLGYAPFFAARDLGFFKEEGLDVKIVSFKGSAVLIPQVVKKTVTIGFPNPDILIISRQPSRDPLPLEFFYNLSRVSLWQFAVLDKSPIKTIEDVRGKTIAIGALGNGNVPIMKAMFKQFGMVLGKDYQFLATGDGAPALNALMTGAADVYNASDVNIENLVTLGAKIRRLDYPKKFSGLMANGMIAHVDTVRDNPKLLAGFGRALTKALVVCEINVDYCIRAFWKDNPNTKPGIGTEESKLEAGRRMLGARMQSYLGGFPQGQVRHFGEYSQSGWEDFVDTLYEGGQISTKNIDVRPLYTNKFVPQFNDFDMKALTEMAKTLK